MSYIIVGLIVLCIVLVCYILFLRKQVERINSILEKRLQSGSAQLVSIELLDKRLNELTISINQCLKAEETLRLKVVHEEHDFKQLIANISHDLRTPLTAIKGYLQLLEKETVAPKQKDRIAIMNARITELEYLIHQFYEYSYLLDMKPTVEITSFSLSNMVAECLASIIPEFEQRGLTLELEESNIWVEADVNMTLRIIQNLLRNCVAHASHSVKVELKQEDRVSLQIKNDMKLDSQIDVTRIFDRFYVADSSRKTTGLGLSIVKLLATNMGCEVEAHLKENWITFICYFSQKVV